MRKLVLGFTFLLALAMTAMAGEWTGYISDAMCANSKGAKVVASPSHAACAKGCIKRGSPAVLVTEDGKIYKIANQSKVVPHAGEKVTLVGTMKGDSITVHEVKS